MAVSFDPSRRYKVDRQANNWKARSLPHHYQTSQVNTCFWSSFGIYNMILTSFQIFCIPRRLQCMNNVTLETHCCRISQKKPKQSLFRNVVEFWCSVVCYSVWSLAWDCHRHEIIRLARALLIIFSAICLTAFQLIASLRSRFFILIFRSFLTRPWIRHRNLPTRVRNC